MSDPTAPPAHLEVDKDAPDRNLALEIGTAAPASAVLARTHSLPAYSAIDFEPTR
jgi:hypothetical protein